MDEIWVSERARPEPSAGGGRLRSVVGISHEGGLSLGGGGSVTAYTSGRFGVVVAKRPMSGEAATPSDDGSHAPPTLPPLVLDGGHDAPLSDIVVARNGRRAFTACCSSGTGTDGYADEAVIVAWDVARAAAAAASEPPAPTAAAAAALASQWRRGEELYRCTRAASAGLGSGALRHLRLQLSPAGDRIVGLALCADLAALASLGAPSLRTALRLRICAWRVYGEADGSRIEYLCGQTIHHAPSHDADAAPMHAWFAQSRAFFAVATAPPPLADAIQRTHAHLALWSIDGAKLSSCDVRGDGGGPLDVSAATGAPAEGGTLERIAGVATSSFPAEIVVLIAVQLQQAGAASSGSGRLLRVAVHESIVGVGAMRPLCVTPVCVKSGSLPTALGLAACGIAVGCADGSVHLFTLDTLLPTRALGFPHRLRGQLCCNAASDHTAPEGGRSAFEDDELNLALQQQGGGGGGQHLGEHTEGGVAALVDSVLPLRLPTGRDFGSLANAAPVSAVRLASDGASVTVLWRDNSLATLQVPALQQGRDGMVTSPLRRGGSSALHALAHFGPVLTMCALPPRGPLDSPLLLTGSADQSVALWDAAGQEEQRARQYDGNGAWRNRVAGGANGAPAAAHAAAANGAVQTTWAPAAAVGGTPAAVIDLPYELCPGMLSYVQSGSGGRGPSVFQSAPLGAAGARVAAARTSMEIVATAIGVDEMGSVLAVGTNKGLVMLFGGDMHRAATVAGDETKRSKLSQLRTFDLVEQLRAEDVARKGHAVDAFSTAATQFDDAVDDAITSVRFSRRRGGTRWIAMGSARGVGAVSISFDMVEKRASCLRDLELMLSNATAVANAAASRYSAQPSPLFHSSYREATGERAMYREAGGIAEAEEIGAIADAKAQTDLSVWLLDCPNLVRGAAEEGGADGPGTFDLEGSENDDAASDAASLTHAATTEGTGNEYGAGEAPLCILWSPHPRSLELRELLLDSSANAAAAGISPIDAPQTLKNTGTPETVRHRRVVAYALDAPCCAFSVARRECKIVSSEADDDIDGMERSAKTQSIAYVLAYTTRGTLLIYAASSGVLSAVIPVTTDPFPPCFALSADPTGSLVAISFGSSDGAANGRCITVVAINNGRTVCVLPAPPTSRAVKRGTKVQYLAEWVSVKGGCGLPPRIATAGAGGTGIAQWSVVSRHRWERLQKDTRIEM